MTVDVRPVRSSSERRDFLDLPRSIYANDTAWVEPLRLELKIRLNPKKNPYFRHGDCEMFMAYRDGRPVGRISTQIDHAAFPGDIPKEGHFGFYECHEDPEVARALFSAATQWLQARRAQKMVGPYNFRLEDPAPGFLSHGFERRPMFMMAYSKPYYIQQAQDFGFSTAMELKSYAVSKERYLPKEMQDKASVAAKIAGMRVREINMECLYDEAEMMRGIFNESLKSNWGFVPFSAGQARAMARDLKMLADPRIILIAEVHGKPVGTVINLPNYYDLFWDCRGRLFPKGLFRMAFQKKKIQGLRGYAMAILPEYQKQGVGTLLLNESFVRALAAGYTHGEITWILGSNSAMSDLSQVFGGVEDKRYTIVEKSLT
jgi:GNAT superfamily N-acetyltransferase